jgi:hypothetical protein
MKARNRKLNESTGIDYLSVYSSQKKQAIKFLNSTIKSVLPYANSAIDDALAGTMTKCYTIDYLISSDRICLEFWASAEIDSITITDATFSVPSKYAGTGWTRASLSGNVTGSVTVGCIGVGRLPLDLSISFTQYVWLYQFSKISIYPPAISISTNAIDLGIAWIWLSNNKLKVENYILGTYSWSLPIQSNINKCFNEDESPLVKTIPTDEIKKYLTLS